LVFIGNLAHWQNFDYLFELVSKNKDYLITHKIRFDIYGDGKEFDRLSKRLSDTNITDLVALKGVIKKADIPSVLSFAAGGVLLDKRFYKGKPLFSPLKMYEYNLFNKPSFFFTEDTLSPLQTEGFYFINGSNFDNLYMLMQNQLEIVHFSRKWDDVADEFLKKVFN
ncbi:MAG: glycosyltransferase, partial [Arcobacter sp.]|nr:glycosyltransferase [Arcobacter sp.]